MLQIIYNLFRLPKYRRVFPRYCRECEYAGKHEEREWSLYCFHPLVNAEDPGALAGMAKGKLECSHGTSCSEERHYYGRPCGKIGFLWEPKEK